MTPVLKNISEKKFIGQRISMSIANNKTRELWRNFMPRRNEINYKVSTDFFSLQKYPSNFNFTNFNVNAEFEKWALIEVDNFDEVPQGVETFILEGGIYAAFIYKGNANNAAEFFKNIFTKWIPELGYEIDSRPHFEILGDKYKRDSDDSEEEIWIPIKLKA